MGGERGRKMGEGGTMYTHVSKCKSNKIEREKIKKKKEMNLEHKQQHPDLLIDRVLGKIILLLTCIL
jgi:hypothetical protein